MAPPPSHATKVESSAAPLPAELELDPTGTMHAAAADAAQPLPRAAALQAEGPRPLRPWPQGVRAAALEGKAVPRFAFDFADPRVEAAPASWRGMTELVRYLLGARDPDQVAHRAVACLGLLPQVSWAELDDAPAFARDASDPDAAAPAQARHAAAPSPGPVVPTDAAARGPVRPESGGLSVELERAYDPSAALLGRRLLTPLRLRVALAEPADPTTFAFVRDLLVLVAEIHRREHDAQRLAREAHTDPLTGLWNRRGFTSFVEQAIARYARAGEPATLMLCDLDHFKRINDSHGHEAGDQTLQAVAQAIHQVTRDTDVGGRLGGDELAILLAGACADQGLTVARRLREVLQATSRTLGFAVTLSVGIADTRALARRGDIEPLVSLLRSADEALYLAKANGRDQAQLAVP